MVSAINISRLEVAVCGLLFLVFSWPILHILAAIYSVEPDYSHGFMVPLVSAYAAWQISQDNPRDKLTGLPHLALGLICLAMGILMIIMGMWYQIALLPEGMGVGFLGAVGIGAMVIGCTAIGGGLRAIKSYSFPLVYLIFAIPFPQSLTQPFTLWLRELVSAIGERMIRLIGLTVYREGNVLHLANSTLGVEDACSGIRSFWMLLAGAVALGWLLQLPWKRSLFLWLCTLPISIAMNSLRVVFTAVMVVRVSPEFASGWRHELSGWCTFIGGLVVLILLANLISPDQQLSGKGINKPTRDLGSGAGIFSPPVKIHRFALCCIPLLGSGIFANQMILGHYHPNEDTHIIERRSLSEFPERLGKFQKVADSYISPGQLEMLNPTEYLIRTFARDGHLVELRLLFWDALLFADDWRGQGYVAGHNPEKCFPSWGYRKVEEFRLQSSPLGPRTVMSLFEKEGKKSLVLFCYKSRFSKDLGDAIGDKLTTLLTSWNNPVINRGSQYLITIIVDGNQDLETAKHHASEFAAVLTPLLPGYGINVH